MAPSIQEYTKEFQIGGKRFTLNAPYSVKNLYSFEYYWLASIWQIWSKHVSLRKLTTASVFSFTDTILKFYDFYMTSQTNGLFQNERFYCITSMIEQKLFLPQSKYDLIKDKTSLVKKDDISCRTTLISKPYNWHLLQQRTGKHTSEISCCGFVITTCQRRRNKTVTFLAVKSENIRS